MALRDNNDYFQQFKDPLGNLLIALVKDGSVVSGKLNDIRFAAQFAIGSSTGGIQEAINDLPSSGGTVVLPIGTVVTTTPITLKSNVTVLGHGANATIIQNASSDLFTASGNITGLICQRFGALSQGGGGHIFNFNSASITQSEFTQLQLVQQNDAKSVLSSVGASAGFFGSWLHDFSYSYSATNTTPAIYISNPVVNNVIIEKFRCTGASTSTAYSIWVEQTATSPGEVVEIRQGTFELPGGGAVNFLSLINSGIHYCGVYDIGVGVNSNPLFHIAKSTFGGAAPSSMCSLDHVFSNVGSATNPDVYFEADVAGQGSFALNWSKVNYLKGGVSGAGNDIILINTTAVHRVNVTSTEIDTPSFYSGLAVNQFTLTVAAPTVGAGQVGLGSTTAASATAGAATLPANPLGFLVANVAGTTVKIPYYNN